jgi:Family of unknown function (DUF5335)
MASRKLDKAQWRPFLERATKMLEGKQAEIEVASLALGDQIEAEWLPLLGLAYDPKDDLIEIALEGLDHMIRKPRELYVEDGTAGLMSLEIVDAEDVAQIVKFREPLMLPPPGRSGGITPQGSGGGTN